MGITPSHLHVPEKASRAKAPTHCPSLCSKSSIPGGKALCPKQVTEKIMEEDWSRPWFPPDQLCTFTCTDICTLGGRWVDSSSLDNLQETQELQEEAKATLEPAEKSANSGAGAWI